MEILFLDRQDPYFEIFSISENSVAEFQSKKIFNLVLTNELIKVEWGRVKLETSAFQILHRGNATFMGLGLGTDCYLAIPGQVWRDAG